MNSFIRFGTTSPLLINSARVNKINSFLDYKDGYLVPTLGLTYEYQWQRNGKQYVGSTPNDCVRIETYEFTDDSNLYDIVKYYSEVGTDWDVWRDTLNAYIDEQLSKPVADLSYRAVVRHLLDTFSFTYRILSVKAYAGQDATIVPTYIFAENVKTKDIELFRTPRVTRNFFPRAANAEIRQYVDCDVSKGCFSKMFNRVEDLFSYLEGRNIIVNPTSTNMLMETHGVNFVKTYELETQNLVEDIKAKYPDLGKNRGYFGKCLDDK